MLRSIQGWISMYSIGSGRLSPRNDFVRLGWTRIYHVEPVSHCTPSSHHLGAHVCVVCRTDKDMQKKQDLAWTCLRCTYTGNRLARRSCSMCGTNRVTQTNVAQVCQCKPHCWSNTYYYVIHVITYNFMKIFLCVYVFVDSICLCIFTCTHIYTYIYIYQYTCMCVCIIYV